MSFAFERDEPVADAVRRVALEQLDGAVHALGDGFAEDVAEAPHQARKRCKKVRALVRLVRPVIGAGTYRFVNDTLRDAAGELSRVRDAAALAATYDAFSRDAAMPEDESARVRAALDERRARLAIDLRSDDPLVVRARESIEQVRDRAARLSLDARGWAALGPGLAKTYGRGRRDLRSVIDAPTGEHFHGWRKRAKYTWYHLRLVGPASPSMLGPLTSRFDELADLLGNAHDLHVLTQQLRSGHEELAAVGDADQVLQRLDEQQTGLEQRAIGIGRRLYVERPDRFATRAGAYWKAWRRLGDEPAPHTADG